MSLKANVYVMCTCLSARDVKVYFVGSHAVTATVPPTSDEPERLDEASGVHESLTDIAVTICEDGLLC